MLRLRGNGGALDCRIDNFMIARATMSIATSASAAPLAAVPHPAIAQAGAALRIVPFDAPLGA